MQKIKELFESRKRWQNNRASAIFPCYVNDKNDQIISFQNYWKWKNNIFDARFYLSLRDEQSNKYIKKEFKILEHNQFSIKNNFNLKKFSGVIECEIISKHNLRFPFPAIICFYKNNSGLISCVHSAGRVLNKNEKQKDNFFEESNFHCKLNKDFEPFIHLFNGNCYRKKDYGAEIKIYNFKNKLLLKKKIITNLLKPYSSKIILLSKVLSFKDLKKLENKKFFIKIKFKGKNIYGRLVVGNYDKKNDALFTTHTLSVFKNGDEKDFIRPKKNKNSTVFLPMMSSKMLNLNSVSYPINQKFSLKFQIKKATQQNKKLEKSKENEIIESKKLFSKRINNNRFALLYSNKKVPGRIYVSHNYSFNKSRHPTDIGMAFHNTKIPNKSRHWGQSVSLKNFDTSLLVRNVSHNLGFTENANCKLIIFNNKRKITKKFILKGDTYKVIKIKNIYKKIKSDFFSWKLYSNEGNLDIIWLSYNLKTKAICGDHCF
jgi:hypothetical protein